MATLVGPVDTPAPFGGVSSIKNTASPTASTHHFDEGKYYLLVVIGELVTDEHLKCAIADIEKGIRSWDTNLIDCNLDQELKLFVSRHSARFSADVRGQKILHHKSNVLETVVLINPSDEAVSTEVRLMVSDTAHHKLLLLAGQCFENTGELILQSGSFSLSNFIDIFTDQEIGELLSTIHPANKANLTIFCPEHGDWKNSNLDKHNLQDFIHMKLNSPTILPEMEGLSEFTEYLSESVEIPSPFDMLEPPTSGGFLKLSKPCCYIFPGGRGDSALFAVNGFNMLINGGSDRKSCFWKLLRHLDRVDSVLLTHIGDDNLPGINSMLQRKIAELEEEQSQESTANSDWTKNMISPDIGVMFVNVPQNLENLEPNYRIRRNAEEVSLMLQYLNKLSLKPEPLHRNIGNTVEPLILFQKMGVGKLEMYVLNPAENSKELQYFLREWTGSDKDKAPILLPNGKESELQISYLSSISSLIVWHPANPSEKIIRVLFPGNSTQNNILEGLEKLKHLDFLKHPVITQKELNSNLAPTLKQAKMKHKTDSKESLKSTSKPSPSKNLHKESKEESLEKLKTLSKTDSVETQEPTQKTEKKEKTLVKKVKTGDKDIKIKTEQTPKIDTPEKKKVDIKPKTMKKETKKSVEKSEANKKAEKPTPKKEEKAIKEEKVKKEEVKKEIKRRDIKKDSLLKESRKDEKKETQKDEKEPKKDLRKASSLKKNAPSTPEVKKPAPKPKVAARGKSPGSPAKSKEKAKPKPTKKDAGKSVEAPSVSSATGEEPAVEASVTDVLEAERSLMSSPEDLTKDFEVLKAEEIAEDDEILSQTKIDNSDQGEMIRHEEITPGKESPEAAESLDEGIATTEAEEECGGTPGDLEPNQKSNGTSEKFEDEGTGLEESSEIGDYEEKGDTEEVDEQDRVISKLKDDGDQEEQETKEGSDYGAEEPQYRHDKESELQSFDVTTPPKISAPVSPAVSIHDETLPAGSECEVASDDENRDDPPEEYTTSGHTQSTIEISSVPTPMDEMSTPRDVMSDETINDESDSPSQDFVKYGMTADYERKNLSPLQDLPELDHSKSDATEGHDYHASASTISPPSSLEEDKSAKEFLAKDTLSFDSNRLSASTTTLPLVRSPSGDQNVNVDHVHAGVSLPIEMGTTLAGMSKGMELCSPDDQTLEGPLSPQSSGHTPYYQSPVEEKAGTLPSDKTPEPQGPIIVDITSDKESSPREASPIDEAVPVSQMGKKQSPSYEAHLSTTFEVDHKTPSQTVNNDIKLATDDSSSVTSATSLPPAKVESLSDTNPFTTFKEDSKMSISEGTTSDTPVDEVVAEDTFSHIASASTTSLATSSLPEPTTDDVSPSLHAEVGSPHSTEVDDSFSVSVVQTPTTMQEAEFSPSKEYSPRPMSISPDVSPKIAKLRMPQQETKSPEQSLSVECGQESPEHSFALDFSKQSPDHPFVGGMQRTATENGPTEVDYSPLDRTNLMGEQRRPGEDGDKAMLFRESDSTQVASVSPSDASQSTPSVTTPCQIGEPREVSSNVGHFSEPVTPKQSPHNHSHLSPDSSLVLGGPSTSHEGTDKDKTSPNSFYKETGMDKIEDRQNLEKTPPKARSPSSPIVSSCFSPKTEELKPGLGTNPFTDSKSPTSPKMSSPAQHSPTSNQTDTHEKFSSSSTSYSYSCQYGESTQICDGGSIGPDTSKTSPPQSRADVDLCLVTSCEYRHPKTELSPSFINPSPLEYFMNEEHPLEEEKPLARSGGGPPPPGGKQQSKQCEETPPTSVSESAPSQTDSDVPPGTEECPSITADANIDSEDDSETLPTDRTITYRHADPPPVMPRDPAPAPPHPDACMVDPEVLKAEEASQKDERGKPKKNINSKTKSSATKSLSKTSAIKESKVSSPKKNTEVTDVKNAKNATNTSASRGVKSSTSGSTKSSSGTSVPNCPPMYMDLVYIPNHCNAKNVDAEFFKRIRSSYYVVSGNDPTAQEPSKAVLDALLEGKSQWGNNMQVTLIPTHDTEVMREWYQETHEKQQDLNIMVLASSSTVVMQDESFPACKIEL
ncbi:microtubule-associated protein 1B-like isoform X2 [Sinocyclocheilus grahami]|uniref:microtubule-associated protein 1B-like isoform X1 n=1 Tax=Sinocyclocheilus grahami TaxID=75366 RepID=UPI0007AC5479|nr:PREDICTED: microtubule-associated protein 1B-like isoform X1 [Sinocyclocheilus grahami]XP_016142329.1 PREDICTED: microtubule-associated protein 1B-like isoform X2 [Sinocyclocheilus grahami]